MESDQPLRKKMSVKVEVSNCQKGSEKYSLRPRRNDRIRKNIQLDKEAYVLGNTNAMSFLSNHKLSTKNHIKQKPATLSKYRRKTANARERSRMREINLAFETLRKAVPSYMPQLVFQGDGANEKLTKITTLRLAMRYIAGLTEMLHKDDRKCRTDETYEFMEGHPIIFRDMDTCTLTALNTSTYDLRNSPSYITDGGSDEESLHSGATINNVIENSLEALVPDVNVDFPDNFFNPDLG